MEANGIAARAMAYRLTRRRTLARVALGGAGVAAIATVGCGSQKKQPSTSGGSAPTSAASATAAAAQPKRGGTVSNSRFSGQQDRTLDPHTNTPVTDAYYRVVYQGLLGYDWPSLKVQPQLAQKWEQPSPTEYLFHLQPGVKFHNKPPANGRAMTVDDIIYSLNRARTKDPQFVHRSLLDSVDKIETADQTTLRITIKGSDAPFLNKLSSDGLMVMAPQVVEKAKKFATPDEAVGTGPFIITQHQSGVGDDFVRNPDYWSPGLPYLDRIRGPVFSDKNTSYAAFQAGQLDLVLIPGSETQKYITQRNLTANPPWGAQNAGTNFLQPSTKVKPFDDARVPRALRLLLDYQELETQWGNLSYGRARNGFALSAALAAWDLSEKEYANYIFWKQPKDDAVKEAISLLSAAGFSKDKPLSYTLAFQDTDDAGQTGAQLMQSQWKRVSGGAVDVQLNKIDQATLNSVRANRQFQMLQASNSGSILDPDAWFTEIYHSTGSRNYSTINDSTLDAMIEKQRGILDEQQRKAAVKEIIVYLIEHSPCTLPYAYDVLSGINPKVHGYKPEGGNVFGVQYDRMWLDT